MSDETVYTPGADISSMIDEYCNLTREERARLYKNPLRQSSFARLYLDRYSSGFKYSREEVMLRLHRREISPSKAEEMLRERKEMPAE